MLPRISFPKHTRIYLIFKQQVLDNLTDPGRTECCKIFHLPLRLIQILSNQRNSVKTVLAVTQRTRSVEVRCLRQRSTNLSNRTQMNHFCIHRRQLQSIIHFPPAISNFLLSARRSCIIKFMY